MTTSVESAVLVVRKLALFFRRGFAIDFSYRFSSLLSLAEVCFPVFMFYFLAKLVDPNSAHFVRYRGGYFGFVCVGIGLNQYFSKALSACGASLLRAQTSGVLEATLSTRTAPASIVLYDGIYQLTRAAANVVAVLGSATLLLGLDLSHANWGVALLGFIVASIVFLGISVISAGIILRIKSRDPVQLVLGSVGTVLAGAYFPVSLMPPWLQRIADFVPMTHALAVMRGALLSGTSLREADRSLLVLAAMALITLPAGILLFSAAVARARRDGTLLQY